MSLEDIESFVRRAAKAGCDTIALRNAMFPENVQEWPCPKFDENEPKHSSTYADIAQEAGTIAQRDSEGLRGTTRYAVCAFKADKQWARCVFVVGADDPAASFRETDATQSGIMAELIRDRRESQKMMMTYTSSVMDRLLEMHNVQAAIAKRGEETRVEMITALEEFLSRKQDRELEREKSITHERMLASGMKTLQDYAPIVANRFLMKQTDGAGNLLPEMFDKLAETMFENKDESMGQKLIEAFPKQEQQAVLFEVLATLEKRYEVRKAAKDREAQQAAEAAKKNGAVA